MKRLASGPTGIVAVVLFCIFSSALQAQVNVTTYHNDNARTGQNTQETILTTANVNSSQFGKLFSVTLDGWAYAQPLYLSNVNIGGGTHNVLYVATEHDSLYAIDADSGTIYWQVSLIAAGGTTVNSSTDLGCGDLVPEVGITGTPVIDPTTGTIYLVAKSKVNGSLVQYLHAINVGTSAEKFSGPVLIQATVPGTASDGNGTTVSFNPHFENQRAGLLLENGHVVIGWSSHCDFSPWHGWIMSYSASTLAQEAAFNTSADGSANGVWMSGGGLAADANGNIFFATGNGTWNGTTDYGDSIVKLGPPSGGSFPVLDYFTPYNQSSLAGGDTDVASGGLVLLPNLSSGQQLLTQMGKEGKMYVIDRNNMGKYCVNDNPPCNGSDPNIVQEIPGATAGVWGTPAYWNGSVYWGGGSDGGGPDNLKAFSFNANNSGLISDSPTSESTKQFSFAAPSPIISANGNTNGILWGLDDSAFGSTCSGGSNCQVLYAYDATNLANMLYNSSQAANNRDVPGGAVKFATPIVANGKVYVGSQLKVSAYGAIRTTPPPPPTNLTATAGNGQVGLSWSGSSGATSYNVKRSTTSGGPYTTIASPTTTSYTDTGVTNGTTYYYVVSAVNTAGESANSGQVSATPSGSVSPSVVLDSSSVGQGALGASSLSWGHTVGSGSNPVLVVGVVGGCTPSVTYAGVSMTHAGQVFNNNQSPETTDLFVLTAPATGTNTVRVSYTGCTSDVEAGSISFTGVNQSTPLAHVTTKYGSGSSASVTVPSASGDMVVDVVGNGSAITSSSQTLLWLKNQNGNTAHGNGAQSMAAGASSVTMGYSVTADWWGIIGADVVAASSLTVPPPPTNVVATAGNGQVGLSWSGSSGATSYNVKRATTSGGPYTTIASPTTTSYTDTGVTNGTTYYYVVSAVNTAGESANSSQVSATPQAVPPPPTNLVATAGNAQVGLSWSGSSGATSYNVKRSTTSGGPYTTIASPTTTSYTDTGVTNGTTYYYVVSAVNTAGESANSGQVSATPSGSVSPSVVLDSSSVGQGALGASSLSWGHTVGSGSNPVLVVGVVGGCTPSVTYAGVSMTHAGQVFNNNQSPETTDLFVLTAPATGTNTVRVSYTGCTSDVEAGSISFTGVNQSTPLAHVTTKYGSGSSASVTVPSASGDMVVDVVGNGSAITSSSQTLLWLKNQNGNTAHGNGAQSMAAGASSVTMGYSVTADWWGIIGADVVAASSLTVPPPPTNVVATAGNGQVGLSWSGSSGATSYNVKRATTSGGPYTTIASPTTTGYTDTGVTNGTTYYYVVSAVNTAGESANSSQVSATPKSASIKFVQVASTQIASSASVSVVYAKAQTAGDLNIVVVGWSDTTHTVSAVSDSSGNTYSLAVAAIKDSTGQTQAIYYAKNIAKAAAGANTVTVTFSGAAIYPDIQILEYSGLSLSNPLDVTAGAAGTSSTASSGSATTTTANELIFGAGTTNGTFAGPGSGFTKREITPYGDIAEDRIVSSTGSYQATAGPVNDGWVMQMATFH